ncbi:glycine radical domain-containing protein, partial [Chelonobacter oris]|uniref:glycine radical domain-containing protein n=1 Tax=Chelonobacter oris TaxID=505317 RepID=UPI0024472429
DRQKLILMLRTFFEVHKGWHIQYNIVSRETLLAAKANQGGHRVCTSQTGLDASLSRNGKRCKLQHLTFSLG